MSRNSLRTLNDVRRYLASLIRRYEAKEIDEIHLKSAAYVSNILTATIKDSDFEQRIDNLETILKKTGAVADPKPKQ